jgi:hypothetical protein
MSSVDPHENDPAMSMSAGGLAVKHGSFVMSGMEGGMSHGKISIEDVDKDPNVDWQKVGRIYKPNEQIESIIEREMQRLKVAMEKKIVI